MKKVRIFILSLILVLSLSACGKNEDLENQKLEQKDEEIERLEEELKDKDEEMKKIKEELEKCEEEKEDDNKKEDTSSAEKLLEEAINSFNIEDYKTARKYISEINEKYPNTEESMIASDYEAQIREIERVKENK